MLRTARRHPNRLVVGIDATAGGLRDASRRARAKSANGGVPNALFGRLPIEDVPGELAGIAEAVTVLLPWGGLLRAVALPDPTALRRLRALSKPDAQLRVVFGYGAGADDGAVHALSLPRLDDPSLVPTLADPYRDAGFAVTVRRLPLDDIRAMPTTWAKKLAFSGRKRAFIEIAGRATHAAGASGLTGHEAGSTSTP